MHILVVADLHMDPDARDAISKASKKCPFTFVAGDIGLKRSAEKYKIFNYMLSAFKSERTYVTPGNHDFWPVNLAKIYGTSSEQRIKVVVDRSITLFDGDRSIRVWFSPWSKQFADWNWMLDETEEEYNIPKDTDVIVTHGPALGIHDTLLSGENAGSYELYKAIVDTNAKAIFSGHIHGNEYGSYFDDASRLWHNVSVLDEQYRFKGKLPVYDTVKNSVELWDESVWNT